MKKSASARRERADIGDYITPFLNPLIREFENRDDVIIAGSDADALSRNRESFLIGSVREMSLAEIKCAVRELSRKELAELAAFILKQDNAAWTRQIEDDAAAGKLDFLFNEADRERASGQLLALHPARG
ncbi:MAG: hypothetical protein WAO00_11395 [Chthoniobacterales bacterium]